VTAEFVRCRWCRRKIYDFTRRDGHEWYCLETLRKKSAVSASRYVASVRDFARRETARGVLEGARVMAKDHEAVKLARNLRVLAFLNTHGPAFVPRRAAR
jgi:hypothetical protein